MRQVAVEVLEQQLALRRGIAAIHVVHVAAAPVPELYAGCEAPQAHGRVSRELEPSRLPAGEVVRVVAGFLAEVDERAPEGGRASATW